MAARSRTHASYCAPLRVYPVITGTSETPRSRGEEEPCNTLSLDLDLAVISTSFKFAAKAAWAFSRSKSPVVGG